MNITDTISIFRPPSPPRRLATNRYYLRPGEGGQLRVSADTEYIFDDRKLMRAASVGRVEKVEVAAAKQPAPG